MLSAAGGLASAHHDLQAQKLGIALLVFLLYQVTEVKIRLHLDERPS